MRSTSNFKRLASTVALLIVSSSVVFAQLSVLHSQNQQKSGKYGTFVTGGVDLNNDGNPDQIVAATYEDVRSSGTTKLVDAGRLYIYNNGYDSLMAVIESPAPSKDGLFGLSVKALSDVSSSAGNQAGYIVGGDLKVRVFSGYSNTVVNTFAPPDSSQAGFFGRSLTVIDSTNIVAVGAYAFPNSGNSQGKVYLFKMFASDTNTIHTRLAGQHTGFGYKVTDAGDVNYDGVNDLLVSAPYTNITMNDSLCHYMGRVYLYDGSTLFNDEPTVLDSIDCPRNAADPYFYAAYFGSNMASIGNVDGVDGDEFVVTSRSKNWVYTYTFQNSHIVVYDSLNCGVGWNYGECSDYIQPICDMDGDGAPDFAIGAIRFSGWGTQKGRVIVVSGATSDTLLTITTTFSNTGDNTFGLSVANAGDIDDDGTDDLIIGAPFEGYTPSNSTTNYFPNHGRAYIYIMPIPWIGGQMKRGGASQTPIEFSFDGAQPNPTNGAIQFSFTIPDPTLVKLSLYNSLGQLVRSEQFHATSGKNMHVMRMDAEASGMYIMKWNAGTRSGSTKITLVK